MDKSAVRNSSEEDLKSMGLIEKGHLICLKTFCNKTEKEFLAGIIKQASYERVSKSSTKISTTPLKRKSSSTRTLNVGWMNYDFDKDRYVSVRSSRGGGSRTLVMSIEQSLTAILETSKELFFSNSKDAEDYKFSIGNSQGIPIEDNDFVNVGSYIETHKFIRVRLYLLSKKKSRFERLQNSVRKNHEDSTFEDDEFNRFKLILFRIS